MKRSGFTMIELIFVIVILGILAAVALPKFIGVSEQAEASKCDAAVGTLNRTVGPAIWAEFMATNPAAATALVPTDAQILTQMPDFDAAFQAKCDAAGTITAVPGSTSTAPSWTWLAD